MLAKRWAILARYGHQDITTLLGRPLTNREAHLLEVEVMELVRNEPKLRLM